MLGGNSALSPKGQAYAKQLPDIVVDRIPLVCFLDFYGVSLAFKNEYTKRELLGGKPKGQAYAKQLADLIVDRIPLVCFLAFLWCLPCVQVYQA